MSLPFLQLKKKTKEHKNQKKTMSLLACHHLLQPKEKNQKKTMSQKACCYLLQPKKKN